MPQHSPPGVDNRIVHRLRAVHYAPAWIRAAVAAALVWIVYALLGHPILGVIIAVAATSAITLTTAIIRHRYGGRTNMRRFFDALRTHQLPVLANPNEARWWHRTIVDERVRRRRDLARAWLYLAGAAVFLVYVLFAIVPPASTWPAIIPAFVVAEFIALYFRVRTANPRILTALDEIARQGAQRGYGAWVGFGGDQSGMHIPV